MDQEYTPRMTRASGNVTVIITGNITTREAKITIGGAGEHVVVDPDQALDIAVLGVQALIPVAAKFEEKSQERVRTEVRNAI